jgi:hypothetical protein
MTGFICCFYLGRSSHILDTVLGLKDSDFARTVASIPLVILFNLTKVVLTTILVTSSYILAISHPPESQR